MDLGERLKLLRESCGILQKELANQLGLSQQTISFYESGRKEPCYETLKNIASYFNVTTDFLLGIEKDDEETKKFACRLKELRNKKEMTQQELATKLNLGRTAIANYETGRTSPDIKTLRKMAIIFETSTDYLLGITDGEKPTYSTTRYIGKQENDDIVRCLEETNKLILKTQKNIVSLIELLKTK